MTPDMQELLTIYKFRIPGDAVQKCRCDGMDVLGMMMLDNAADVTHVTGPSD